MSDPERATETPAKKPTIHPAREFAGLLAALQTGPDALTKAGAALLGAHLIGAQGALLAAKLKASDVHALVSAFRAKNPMGWQALLLGDVVRFVRFCEIAHIEHEGELALQHMMSRLLESPTPTSAPLPSRG
jgi:hypothetical protein